MPTFVEIAGGPKGKALKKQIRPASTRASSRPSSGRQPARLSDGQVGEVGARYLLLLFGGAVPSAVRYKNWKIYFAMASEAATGLPAGSTPSTGLWSSTSSAIRSRCRSVSNSTSRSQARAAHLPDPRPLISTTGTSAHRPGAVAAGNSSPTGHSRRMQTPASYSLAQVLQQVKEQLARTGSRDEDVASQRV